MRTSVVKVSLFKIFKCTRVHIMYLLLFHSMQILRHQAAWHL
jgi:hypothetical protein